MVRDLAGGVGWLAVVFCRGCWGEGRCVPFFAMEAVDLYRTDGMGWMKGKGRERKRRGRERVVVILVASAEIYALQAYT